MDYVAIADKDGGLAAELRAPKGDIPVFMSPSGDRTYWQESISITGTGDNTIHTVASGKRFHITSLYLTVQHAGAMIRLKSGATSNLSGDIRLAAQAQFSVAGLTNDVPVLDAVTADHNFVINTSGDYIAPYVAGFVRGYDE